MAITMHPVTSDGIQAVGYDPQRGEIHIAFKSGGTHPFGHFTAAEFERFKSAPSIGKHFHAHIKAKAIK